MLFNQMSFKTCIIILFLITNLSDARKSLISLDIDRQDGENFKLENTQIDNVFYKHFTPINNNFVVKVNDFADKIWDSTGYARCVYALLAHSNEEPYLLYLQIDYGFKTKHEYFKKINNVWNSIDIDEYCNSIVDVKKHVKKVREFELDISGINDDNFFSSIYATREKPYTFYSSNIGYFATSVSYSYSKLWSSEHKGDRCVAVWAYIHNGSYYILRLLLTNDKEESELKTFFFINGKWVHVHTLEENHDKALYVQKPEDFPYPDYTFNQKRIKQQKVSTQDQEAQTQESSESYFDLSGDYYTFKVHDDDNYTEEDQMYGLTTEPSKGEVDKSNENYFDLTGDYYDFKVQDDDTSHDKSDTGTVYRPMVLDISLTVGSLFSGFREVDNVSYKTYQRLIHAPINKVIDRSLVVWEARSREESCEYAMAPQNNGEPTALFLRINVKGQPRQAFFRKSRDAWERSNFEEYKKTLEFLKSFVIPTQVELDLEKRSEWSKNMLELKLNDDFGSLLLPKSGFTCHSVVHDSLTIWESSNPYDRCVAAWVYENDGKFYLTKLLLVYQDGTSDLVSYLNVRNFCVLISSYNWSNINKNRFKKPENFYNPEYEFNQDMLDYEFAESASYPTKKRTFAIVRLEDRHTYVGDYSALEAQKSLEESESESKTDSVPQEEKQSEAEDEVEPKIKEEKLGLSPSEYIPDYRPIEREDCLTLNLNKKLNTYYDIVEAVFDGKLELISYQPPEGKYFDVIYDGKKPIFLGHHMTHLCFSVNIYTRKNHLYLADMLIKVKNEDLTLYLCKGKKGWVYINREMFVKLLERLIKKSSSDCEKRN